MTATPHTPGAFVWHELRTFDVAKAKAFYTGLFGWTYEQSPMVTIEYHLISLDGKRVGGLFNAQGHDFPAHWGSFISVDDVDQAAERAAAAGGEICNGPDDIPNVGRFAQIQDPQGAFVALYKDVKGDPDPMSTIPGQFCWDQLNTTDMNAGTAFYEKVVGWTTDRPAPDMGIFKYGDAMEASTGPVPAGVPAHWLPFVLVTSLAETAQKAQTLGATVLMADLPAGPFGRFSVLQDPTGAHFGIFQGHEQGSEG